MSDVSNCTNKRDVLPKDYLGYGTQLVQQQIASTGRCQNYL
jgi:hypothetical protein